MPLDNIVEKGENAGNHQFLLFQQSFNSSPNIKFSDYTKFKESSDNK